MSNIWFRFRHRRRVVEVTTLRFRLNSSTYIHRIDYIYAHNNETILIEWNILSLFDLFSESYRLWIKDLDLFVFANFIPITLMMDCFFFVLFFCIYELWFALLWISVGRRKYIFNVLRLVFHVITFQSLFGIIEI